MSRSEIAEVWQKRLLRFASSEMTVKEFCACEGVSQPSFYSWKKKLRELRLEMGDGHPKPTAGKVQFMPLCLGTEAASQAALQAASKSNDLAPRSVARTTIELPGGVRICVEAPADGRSGQQAEARS